MGAWSPEQLAAAVGVLAAAICANAVLVAKTYAQVANIIQGLGRHGVSIRGSNAPSVPGVPNAANTAAGGSAAPDLLGIPAWQQRADLSVSTAPAWTGATDCGPEAVAMCIYAVRGVETIAQLLRLRWFGAIDARLTTAADLVGMFSRNHIPASASNVPGMQLAAWCQAELGAGRPCIVLKRYSVGVDALHWVVMDAAHADATYRDPWDGMNHELSWSDLAALYAGVVVTCGDRASY